MVENEEYVPKTECKDCVFRSDVDGIQTGCKLGRLKRLEQNGAVLIKPDGDKDHYTIERRNCSALRTKQWLKGKDPNLIQDIVYSEVLIRPEAFVLFDGNDWDLESLEFTLKLLNEQTLSPSKIVIIHQGTRYKPSEILSLLNKQELEFRLDNLQIDMDWKDALDLSIKKCQSSYLTVLGVGPLSVPKNYFGEINKAINYKMEKFLAIVPVLGLHGLFIPLDAYKNLGGNADSQVEGTLEKISLITDKLRLVAKEYNQEEMLINYDDFVSRL